MVMVPSVIDVRRVTAMVRISDVAMIDRSGGIAGVARGAGVIQVVV